MDFRPTNYPGEQPIWLIELVSLQTLHEFAEKEDLVLTEDFWLDLRLMFKNIY